jgi:4-hydroxybenzoate polyprenyltransferase
VLGAFLAGPTPDAPGKDWWTFAGQMALVLVCMVAARTWAMLINRLADRSLDAQNDRTARRVLASGQVRPWHGWLVAAAAAAAFGLAAWGFYLFFRNPWPAYLAAPVLAFLAFYSFTKRFTWLCHLVLGLSLAASPLAAALAVRPDALLNTPSLWWMAGFVALWVAGFDVIYALQDRQFDEQRGLSSVPVKLGIGGAVWASRAAHALALLGLLAAWTSHPRFGWVFGSGVVAVGMTLVLEHAVLGRSLAKTPTSPALHAAFFTVNGFVSCAVGAAGVVDLWRN